MRQQHAAVVLVLLLLLAAAAMPPLASARLLVLSNTTLTHFAEITALFGLPKEQLSLGVSDKDFLAVLGKALEATDMLVQQQADKRDDDALYQLAMDIASKTLDGPRDFVLQGLGNTFVLKLPASFPTVTYPMINITNFPTMPWLNKTVTIKGMAAARC